MSVLVEQQVLELEVAVDDALAVQVAERGHDLGAVEARALLAEGALARQVEEQLAAVRVLHHEAHAVHRLERVAQRLRPTPAPDPRLYIGLSTVRIRIRSEHRPEQS